MRVLWLTLAQLPAVTGSSAMTFAGWLEGMRQALERYEPDVELGIVSSGSVAHEPITSGNATYFSLRTTAPSTRLGRIARAWQMGTAPPEAVHQALEIGRRFEPDIVHLHGTEHFLGLAALQFQTPCVATLQGIATALEPYMRSSMHISEIGRSVTTREFVRGGSPLHFYLGMRRAAGVEREVVGGLRYFMGQTDWDHNVVRLLNPSATYFDCSRVLQPAYYSARWRGSAKPNATIVCTSSPMPYKGIDTLLEGVQLLVQAGHKHLRLRIIGGFRDSNLWPRLSHLVQRRGLEGVVTWLGPLQAPQIASELSDATLFVMPSHIENESNTLIEAMLVGVPCVAAAVGGVPSVVRNGLDAVLYHDSDPFALAGAIDGLLNDPGLARSLGDKARAHALARFDPEAGAHRTRAVYDQVLALASESRSTAPQAVSME